MRKKRRIVEFENARRSANLFSRGECVGCGTKFDEKNSWPLVSRFPGHEKRTVKREKGGKKRKGGEREREEGNKTSKKQREKRFEALLETSREAGREGKRGKKGQEAAKAEQERRLKASAG